MQLKTFSRASGSKSELNKIRRSGNIPAVIYSKGQPGQNIAVDGTQFRALLRNVKKGCLSTVKIALEGEIAVEEAVLKEIQYHPTTDQVWHLDLEALDQAAPVKVKIPVICTGVPDCVGIKLGGTLRQVIRAMRVSCLPKDMPSEFQIDIRDLQIGQTKRLSDIAIPDNVTPLVDLNEVAVVIAKG